MNLIMGALYLEENEKLRIFTCLKIIKFQHPEGLKSGKTLKINLLKASSGALK